jgi:hypothetical protein
MMKIEQEMEWESSEASELPEESKESIRADGATPTPAIIARGNLPPTT